MKISHIFFLVLFSLGMGVGQLLLKFSAQRQVSSHNSNLWHNVRALLTDWPFLAGALSYGVLLFFWVWLLSMIPLSRAYPFTLVTILVTALGGWHFFNEALTVRYAIGVSIIFIGLLILSTE